MLQYPTVQHLECLLCHLPMETGRTTGRKLEGNHLNLTQTVVRSPSRTPKRNSTENRGAEETGLDQLIELAEEQICKFQ